MTKITTLLASALLISSCATYTETRKPENMTEVTLNTDYQTAYKQIRSKLITECKIVENAITGDIFSDSKTAELNIAVNGSYTLSLDFQALTDNKTQMKHYSYYKENRFLNPIKQWINEDKNGCK